MITNDVSCTREIQSTFAAKAKTSFIEEEEEESFHQQTGLKFREETSQQLNF